MPQVQVNAILLSKAKIEKGSDILPKSIYPIIKDHAIQYRINCLLVTAILTKQGKKKKTMSGLKYPNKNE